MTSAPTSCIRWFNDLRLTDLPLVGGKNASLGEMARELTPLGVRIPACDCQNPPHKVYCPRYRRHRASASNNHPYSSVLDYSHH